MASVAGLEAGHHLRIEAHPVLPDDSVYVIAEAGVNHNGDLQRALELVDIATDAGCDAVKFQTFRAEEIASRSASKAAYQIEATGGEESQYEMIRRLELTEPDHRRLMERARSRGIDFLSTPFDLPSLRMLTDGFGITMIKIASGELTNAPFLLAVARAAERVIVSTGMSTLDEVRDALSVLAYGFTAPPDATPQRADFFAAFESAAGREMLRRHVVLLHCTTEYPAPVAEVNLRAMDTLAEEFGLPVGYSDHTTGIHVAVAAAARGARIIEKHFTSDRGLPGPDHKASLEPAELREMVRQIREVAQALGDGVKRPTSSELKNRDVARKSLVAAKAIATGERFDEENVACKRPGTGASPFQYWSILGQTAKRSYAPDETLDV